MTKQQQQQQHKNNRSMLKDWGNNVRLIDVIVFNKL